jgi:hypothetical protein
LKSNRYGIHHRIGIGVAKSEIGKPQSRCSPVGGEHQTIVLKRHQAWSKGSGVGRSNGPIQKDAVA